MTTRKKPSRRHSTRRRRLTESEIAQLPERERWLFRNPTALALVERGLADAAAGRFADPPPDING